VNPKNRRRLLIALIVAAAFGAVQMLGAGCAEEQALAQKESSFRSYLDRSIRGEPATEYLGKRTCLLVCGALVEKAELVEASLSMKLGPSESWSTCSAVCLTIDGYYLTAAHCLDLVPWTIVVSDATRTHFAQAREVWRSETEDVALIHASVRPRAVFDRQATPGVGDAVLVMGAVKGPAAGSFRSKERSVTDPDVAMIRHDAMVVGGDSGGPVLTASGELIGVTGRASYFWILGFLIKSGAAYQVRQEKLDALIAADRGR
jgi:S1-C subfamily serine protease